MLASTLRRRSRRDNAEVGVGTLIIFIAMVLVAAVAAAVIIGTSGTLQQRAQQTGKDATSDVSSNMRIESAYGIRATSNDDVGSVRLIVTLAAGSVPVDLTETIIRYSDGSSPTLYKFGDLTYPFTLNWVRGTATDNVIEAGDLVELDFDLPSDLPPRSDFRLQLIHIIGAPQELDLVTPSTYAGNLYLELQ